MPSTAREFFSRIELVLSNDAIGEDDAKNIIHDTLVLVCNDALKDSQHAYGNLSTKVEAVCRQHRMKARDTRYIHRMRHNSTSRTHTDRQQLPYDCRALALLISTVYNEHIPSTLNNILPKDTPREEREPSDHTTFPYLRCIVKTWDHDTITAVAAQDSAATGEIRINYGDTPDYIDYSYLRNILKEGMQLNILDMVDSIPRYIIVEPDYLIDISTIANCFEDYGHHPLIYTLKRMQPRPNNRYTILGNFAGTALDDIINKPEGYDIADTIRSNFREKALEYSTARDLDTKEFKREAARQVENIKQITKEIFTHYDRSKAILEPSFVCEALGLQGRVDLMTTDMRLLVEQKSSKNQFIERNTTNRHGSTYAEKHYVQLLLYYAVLKYNFHLPDNHAKISLLYSRYALPHGLTEIQPLQKLIREALKLRNQVVATEFYIAEHGFQVIAPLLSADTLNTERLSNYFYNNYLLPELQHTLLPLDMLSPVEKAYFHRMVTFVIQEQIASKLGAQQGVGSSQSDLWSMTLQEKIATGNIYTQLSIIKKEKSNELKGYDNITLAIPYQGRDFLPNFRRGDMVYLYAYPDGDIPDVRRSLLFKGTLAHIATDRITVHLSNSQQNPDIFSHTLAWKGTDTPCHYAIEHASSDIGSNSAIQGLHAFITGDKRRRDILLAQKAPTANTAITLSRHYHPDYDDIILRSRQATDYFLLIGPPGTGKTSMALRFLVEEELAATNSHSAPDSPQPAVLLLSYTNRAVDEICSMLEDAGIDYLRLGSRYSCDPRFTPHLIEETIERQPRLDILRQTMARTQVVVSTTSTLQARPYLLNAKKFSLAIVDEAGQILEPNIIGIVSATNIGRFILIGDHKQLPAVVQQTSADAAVSDELLRDIHLESCSNSLFERLLHIEQAAHRSEYIGILHKQGRMHPDIALFPSHAFYSNEQIVPVPLPHQQEKDLGYRNENADEMGRKLSTSRILFVDTKHLEQRGNNDTHAADGDYIYNKVGNANAIEARIVADILKRIYGYYADSFNADKTVGVIVPYRNQIATIRQELERTGIEPLRNISIDTVERYQGSQREVIVYSFTVRQRHQLDFLTANTFEDHGMLIDRKLNVAMTRARRQLIMVGNSELLTQKPLFKKMIGEIEKIEII